MLNSLLDQFAALPNWAKLLAVVVLAMLAASCFLGLVFHNNPPPRDPRPRAAVWAHRGDWRWQSTDRQKGSTGFVTQEAAEEDAKLHGYRID